MIRGSEIPFVQGRRYQIAESIRLTKAKMQIGRQKCSKCDKWRSKSSYLEDESICRICRKK